MDQVERARARRWSDLLSSERAAAARYSGLAETESGERRAVFEELAAVERGDAGHWEDKLRDAGVSVPQPGGLVPSVPVPSVPVPQSLPGSLPDVSLPGASSSPLLEVPGSAVPLDACLPPLVTVGDC